MRTRRGTNDPIVNRIHFGAGSWSISPNVAAIVSGVAPGAPGVSEISKGILDLPRQVNASLTRLAVSPRRMLFSVRTDALSTDQPISRAAGVSKQLPAIVGDPDRFETAGSLRDIQASRADLPTHGLRVPPGPVDAVATGVDPTLPPDLSIARLSALHDRAAGALAARAGGAGAPPVCGKPGASQGV